MSKLSVDVSEDLLQKLKIYCVFNKTTNRKIIEDFLIEFLANNSTPNVYQGNDSKLNKKDSIPIIKEVPVKIPKKKVKKNKDQQYDRISEDGNWYVTKFRVWTSAKNGLENDSECEVELDYLGRNPTFTLPDEQDRLEKLLRKYGVEWRDINIITNHRNDYMEKRPFIGKIKVSK